MMVPDEIQTMTVRQFIHELTEGGDFDSPVYIKLGAPSEHIPWHKIAYVERQDSGLGTSQFVIQAYGENI